MSAHASPYPQPTYPQKVTTVRPYKKWPWLLGILLAFVLGATFGAAAAGAAGTGSTSSPVGPSHPSSQFSTPGDAGTPVEDTTAALPAGAFTDGKYEIGSEIDPGTYKTAGPPESSLTKMCSWARYQTADTEALPANAEFVQGQSTITVARKGYIQFTGGCIWQKQ